MPKARQSDVCTICGGPYRALGLCKKHYSELQRRRLGIPARVPAQKKRAVPKTTRLKYGPLCTAPDCDRPHRARGFCAYHYNLTYHPNKTGGTGKRGRKTKGEVIGYRAAHLNVEKTKGKAKSYDCVCGNPAQEWALDPLAVHTYEDEQGRVWSLNIDDYKPMCCSCHRKLDGQTDLWYVDLWIENKIQ